MQTGRWRSLPGGRTGKAPAQLAAFLQQQRERPMPLSESASMPNVDPSATAFYGLGITGLTYQWLSRWLSEKTVSET